MRIALWLIMSSFRCIARNCKMLGRLYESRWPLLNSDYFNVVKMRQKAKYSGQTKLWAIYRDQMVREDSDEVFVLWQSRET